MTNQIKKPMGKVKSQTKLIMSPSQPSECHHNCFRDNQFKRSRSKAKHLSRPMLYHYAVPLRWLSFMQILSMLKMNLFLDNKTGFSAAVPLIPSKTSRWNSPGPNGHAHIFIYRLRSQWAEPMDSYIPNIQTNILVRL